MSLLRKELFSQLKPHPILAHDGLFMPEFPDELMASIDIIFGQALLQGKIPRGSNYYKPVNTKAYPVEYENLDIAEDVSHRRSDFLPRTSEDHDPEWIKELYGCLAIAFATTHMFDKDFRHFYQMRSEKMLNVPETKNLLRAYARDHMWIHWQTELLRKEDSAFNYLIENVAQVKRQDFTPRDTHLPVLEEQYLRSMHLSPLTGTTPSGKFKQVLELLMPGRIDKSVPQFIERTRENSKILLMGTIQSTGNNSGYVGRSLTERLLDVQSQLLKGIPYAKGLRTENIRVGNIKLEAGNVRDCLGSIERQITGIFRESWKTDNNYMMAYLWKSLITNQPLGEANKRCGFFTMLSYALEYGEPNLVNTPFIPQMFIGDNDIRPAISQAISHPECKDRTYTELLASAIANSPKLTIEQYANLMFEKGYSFRN